MATTNLISQPVQAIPLRDGLSYQEFENTYLFPGQPVVITDGLKDWKAVGKWTPDFFRRTYPNMPVSIYDRTYSMPEFIGLVENSTPERPAPYFRNEQVRQVFPELLPDLQPDPIYILPNWLRGPFYPNAGKEAEIYIGGAGRSFPLLHYDANSTHAFLGQIHGEKEVILYSPAETHRMYPKERPRHHSHITDITKVDSAKFPLFAAAVAHKATLTPGALLFIPCRWWHTARMSSPSITVSYNVANQSNWASLREEILHNARYGNPLRPPVLSAYLAVMGWVRAAADFGGPY